MQVGKDLAAKVVALVVQGSEYPPLVLRSVSSPGVRVGGTRTPGLLTLRLSQLSLCPPALSDYGMPTDLGVPNHREENTEHKY